jgi:hypothetical protein
VKRRDRLTGQELKQFKRAIECAQWARMGTNGEIADLGTADPSACGSSSTSSRATTVGRIDVADR